MHVAHKPLSEAFTAGKKDSDSGFSGSDLSLKKRIQTKNENAAPDKIRIPTTTVLTESFDGATEWLIQNLFQQSPTKRSIEPKARILLLSPALCPALSGFIY
jgi:hypothetical protein